MTAAPEDIRGIYDRQAAVYDAARSRALFEARWLARFAACLPDGARVLDLGCGAGEPIARWFIAEGYRVTGMDFAPAMLEIARSRWPDGDWRQGDMRKLDLGEHSRGSSRGTASFTSLPAISGRRWPGWRRIWPPAARSLSRSGRKPARPPAAWAASGLSRLAVAGPIRRLP